LMTARNMEDQDLVLNHTNGLMPQIQRDTEEVDQDLVHMNG